MASTPLWHLHRARERAGPRRICRVAGVATGTRSLTRAVQISRAARNDTRGRARLRGWRRLHVPLSALLVVAALLGAYRLVTAWQEGLSGGHDFVQDYAAIRAIVEGRNPYEPYNEMTQRLFGGPPHRGNLYSFHAPSSLIFFMPLAPLSYGAAFVVWGVVSLISLWVSCWLVIELGRGWWGGGEAADGTRSAPSNISLHAVNAIVALMIAFGLVMLPAVRENFVEGQLNVVVTAGMVGTWAAFRAGKLALAGVVLGATFALKPIPGLFFIYFLWRREWRLLMWSVIALAAFNLIGLLLAGLDGAILYATVNYPDHAQVWPGYPDNASLRGLFTRLFGPSPWRRPPYPVAGAAMAAWIATAVLAAGLFWAAARKAAHDGDRDLELAAMLALTLLVTPIVWPHYYVVLAPGVAILGAWLWLGGRAGRRPDWVGLLLLVAACGGLAAAHYVEPYRGSGGQQLVLLMMVYGLGLAVLWRERRGRTRLPSQ